MFRIMVPGWCDGVSELVWGFWVSCGTLCGFVIYCVVWSALVCGVVRGQLCVGMLCVFRVSVDRSGFLRFGREGGCRGWVCVVPDCVQLCCCNIVVGAVVGGEGVGVCVGEVSASIAAPGVSSVVCWAMLGWVLATSPVATCLAVGAFAGGELRRSGVSASRLVDRGCVFWCVVEGVAPRSESSAADPRFWRWLLGGVPAWVVVGWV